MPSLINQRGRNVKMSMVKKSEEQKLKDEQMRNPEKFFISSHGHPRDRIIINENPNIPPEGVFLSLNGYAFLAKPGVEIDIPRPVRKMLDTRIETVTTYDTNGKEYTRNVQKYSYVLVAEDVKPENVPEMESFNDRA